MANDDTKFTQFGIVQPINNIEGDLSVEIYENSTSDQQY